MRFANSRRKTYPGLTDGRTKRNQEADRISIIAIAPRKVKGFIRSYGKAFIPMNRAMSLMPRGTHWRLSTNRRTPGGASPFYGSNYKENAAVPISGVLVTVGGNRAELVMNRRIAAGVSFKWLMTINGVEQVPKGVSVADDDKTVSVVPEGTLLATDIVTVSHPIPGEGIAVITDYPVPS